MFPAHRSSQNHLARHSERGKKTRRTKEEVGRQHQGVDRPGVRQVPEDSKEQRKMEKTGCKIICGAPTTLAVKGLKMMMMMKLVSQRSAGSEFQRKDADLEKACLPCCSSQLHGTGILINLLFTLNFIYYQTHLHTDNKNRITQSHINLKHHQCNNTSGNYTKLKSVLNQRLQHNIIINKTNLLTTHTHMHACTHTHTQPQTHTHTYTHTQRHRYVFDSVQFVQAGHKV